jgi:hypothetical protein
VKLLKGGWLRIAVRAGLAIGMAGQLAALSDLKLPLVSLRLHRVIELLAPLPCRSSPMPMVDDCRELKLHLRDLLN